MKSPQEYVIERIISYTVSDVQKHPYIKLGGLAYRVQWYGFDSDEKTFEPIRDIPRSKIVSYYKRMKQLLPDSLNEAQQG